MVVEHNYKKQNKVTDALAKERARMQKLGNETVFVIPMCAQEALWMDMPTTNFVRQVKSCTLLPVRDPTHHILEPE